MDMSAKGRVDEKEKEERSRGLAEIIKNNKKENKGKDRGCTVDNHRISLGYIISIFHFFCFANSKFYVFKVFTGLQAFKDFKIKENCHPLPFYTTY